MMLFVLLIEFAYQHPPEETPLELTIFGYGCFFLLGLNTVYFIRKHTPYFNFHIYIPLRKLAPTRKHILQTQVSFYQNLSDKKKKYFEHRVAVFLDNHPIVGREGLYVTPQMRVLIAACSVALTFGYKRYLYRSFKHILLYPDIYYSNITEEYHKGEFNPRNKVVVFSWKHFLEGFEVNDDNINLGLHEFAHALHFEMKLQHPHSESFKRNFYGLLQELRRPEKRQKLLESDYFREYGLENKYEFLAVLIEAYFETPKRFSEEFPLFYERIQRMLNQ